MGGYWGFNINYKNTKKLVSCSDLEYLVVKEVGKIEPKGSYPDKGKSNLLDVTLELKMKASGIIVNQQEDVFYSVYVSYLDDLTGKIKETHIPVGLNNAVNIRKIVFNK